MSHKLNNYVNMDGEGDQMFYHGDRAENCKTAPGSSGSGSDMKLTFIHLRYFPPGLNLEYKSSTTNKIRKKPIDLINLQTNSKLEPLICEIMRNEYPNLTKYNIPILAECLEKLKAKCKQDYIHRFQNQVGPIHGHMMPILGACLSRKGDRCATVGYDKTCKIWDSRGNETQSLTGHYDAVSCVSFDDTGEKVLTGACDGNLFYWKIDDKLSNEPLYKLRGSSGEIQCLQFSLDCYMCASGSSTGRSRIFDLTNGLTMYSFAGHTAGISDISFDRSGNTLLTGSVDKTIGIWDLRSGTSADYLKGHEYEIVKCSFNFNGDLVASCSLDHTVRLWDVRSTNQCLAVLKDHTDQVCDVQFNFTGKSLASACKDGHVIVWNALTTTKLLDFKAHEGQVNQVSFSPNGGLLLTCGEDCTAKTWHAEFGNCLQTLEGQTLGVFTAKFNYFGDVILTVARDNTIQFWK